ncbi:hypothetical protein PR048_003451 [Dryococelus australis]|uniref:SWIM-type domain-containing protein n=1 Tax=Dryococelus australis TaxID=614101 RepID=A0ABQ9IN60_9NEOP|nr:hypothetical protein PR048_003451 [Dryococelus australis]
MTSIMLKPYIMTYVERYVFQKCRKGSWGRADVVVRLLASHLGVPGSIPGWAAPGFPQVGIVPDGAAPYSPRFTLISSQDLDVKSRPNPFTHSFGGRRRNGLIVNVEQIFGFGKVGSNLEWTSGKEISRISRASCRRVVFCPDLGDAPMLPKPLPAKAPQLCRRHDYDRESSDGATRLAAPLRCTPGRTRGSILKRVEDLLCTPLNLWLLDPPPHPKSVTFSLPMGGVAETGADGMCEQTPIGVREHILKFQDEVRMCERAPKGASKHISNRKLSQVVASCYDGLSQVIASSRKLSKVVASSGRQSQVVAGSRKLLRRVVAGSRKLSQVVASCYDGLSQVIASSRKLSKVVASSGRQSQVVAGSRKLLRRVVADEITAAINARGDLFRPTQHSGTTSVAHRCPCVVAQTVHCCLHDAIASYQNCSFPDCHRSLAKQVAAAATDAAATDVVSPLVEELLERTTQKKNSGELPKRGHGGVVARLLASQKWKLDSIPGGVGPVFSHLGIVHPGAAPYSPRFTLIGSLRHTPLYCTSPYVFDYFLNTCREAAMVEWENNLTCALSHDAFCTDMATVAERLACSPPTMAIRVQSPAGSLQFFACGDHARRCRCLAGLLGDLPCSHQSPSSALKNIDGGETGDPRENPLTVRQDSHMRKYGVIRPRIEPGSPWWEASGLTARPRGPNTKLIALQMNNALSDSENSAARRNNARTTKRCK